MAKNKIELYGTGWCPKSALIRNYLQSEWIEFEDFNVENTKDAENKIRNLFNGFLKFPVVIYKSHILKNPSIGELNSFLRAHYLRD